MPKFDIGIAVIVLVALAFAALWERRERRRIRRARAELERREAGRRADEIAGPIVPPVFMAEVLDEIDKYGEDELEAATREGREPRPYDWRNDE